MITGRPLKVFKITNETDFQSVRVFESRPSPRVATRTHVGWPLRSMLSRGCKGMDPRPKKISEKKIFWGAGSSIR